MRIRRAAAFAVVALAAGGEAEASDEISSSSGSAPREQSHLVEITLHPRYAELVVRRTLQGTGSAVGEADLMLDVPPGGVATGLRSLTSLPGEAPRWLTAELLPTDKAETRYQGAEKGPPADAALLAFLFPTTLRLTVFPVAPNEPKTVEYTLLMPTEYEGGRDHLKLPKMGTEDLTATGVLRAADPGDAVSVDGRAVRNGEVIKLAPSADGELDLALSRRRAPAVSGALAMVPFADDRVLFQLRVDAAAKISEVPRGAYVAVVVDASRSMEGADLVASAARAYLSHFEDAHVEVIAFDRRVRARHGRFVAPAVAREGLAGWVGPGKNGSQIDEALARADAVLAAAPGAAPKRIVVFTDLRTRDRLDPSSLRPAPASGALVHVAVVASGAPSLVRDDDDGPWSALARKSGGLLWSAAASSDASEEKEMVRTFEELARPVRIDKLRVVAPDIDDLSVPDQLEEGAGITDLRIHPRQVPWVTVDGELWSTPIHKQLRPDERARRLWSALAIGSPLFFDLAPGEIKTLAEIGHAVSPATSLVASTPGARPRTGRSLDGGIGSTGIGGGSGSSHCRMSCSAGSSFDHAGWLRKALAPALQRCGASRATIDIQTTLREVVDVTDVRVEDASKRRCLEEAAWELDLPEEFRMQSRSYSVELPLL